jgi:hypothetical protein
VDGHSSNLVGLRWRRWLAVLSILLIPLRSQSQVQVLVDSHFDTSIDHPVFLRSHPTVVVDEAHWNYHTATGRYEPLAKLLRHDGYIVVPGKSKFLGKRLKGVRVLLVANARGQGETDTASGDAFTRKECMEVADWVLSGGSLLLIADHTPFGGAASSLAHQFGVEMDNSYVFDSSNSADEHPTFLIFSRDNGLLGDHAITKGRVQSEAVVRVVAFTGQSLSIPPGATALLKFGATAYGAPTKQDLDAAEEAASRTPVDIAGIMAHARPVAGKAQGIALSHGKGRVVIVGEAAMFSAQILMEEQGHKEEKFGMNAQGNDDKRFVLNVFHWLSESERESRAEGASRRPRAPHSTM